MLMQVGSRGKRSLPYAPFESSTPWTEALYGFGGSVPGILKHFTARLSLVCSRCPSCMTLQCMLLGSVMLWTCCRKGGSKNDEPAECPMCTDARRYTNNLIVCSVYSCSYVLIPLTRRVPKAVTEALEETYAVPSAQMRGRLSSAFWSRKVSLRENWRAPRDIERRQLWQRCV